MPKRREILIAGGALLLAPAVLAQRAAESAARIGVLDYGTREDGAHRFADFRQGLREGGFVEGPNLRFEYRFAGFDYFKLERLAEELVQARVQVIYADTTWPARAAHAVTKSVPIVFSGVNDPVVLGLVASLARPGGNVTGATGVTHELTVKRVELMKELFGGSALLGVIYDTDSAKACAIEIEQIQAGAQKLGVTMQSLPYASSADLQQAFDQAERAGLAGLLVPTSLETRRFGAQLNAEAARRGIPLIHDSERGVAAGGLMSYSAPEGWSRRRAGYLVSRILKGAKPAELPVERPTRFDLSVNLRKARELKVRIPPSIMLRADSVID